MTIRVYYNMRLRYLRMRILGESNADAIIIVERQRTIARTLLIGFNLRITSVH